MSEMPLLEVTDLTRSFGGLLALSAVSLAVDAGEAVGVVGPNGAGKTTLFDCVAGRLPAESGTISFRGRRIDRLPAFERSRLGMASTFQRLEVFTGMTPREHLLVAARVHEGTGRLWKDLLGLGLPTKLERQRCEEILDVVGLFDVADTPVEALSLGLARLVELARAMASSPRLLLLDEPSSGLDDRERAMLGAAVERARAEWQTAILLVEHDLGFVEAMVSRLAVLESGRIIADGPVDAVLRQPEVRRAYLGVST